MKTFLQSFSRPMMLTPGGKALQAHKAHGGYPFDDEHGDVDPGNGIYCEPAPELDPEIPGAYEELVVFAYVRDHNSEIYSMKPEGSIPVNISNHVGHDFSAPLGRIHA